MINQLRKPWMRQIFSILPKQCIIEDPSELFVYNQDWTKAFKGASKLAIAPQNTEQLSNLMKLFNQQNVKVVPQGGRTGLVGGGVPINDEVIILMKNFNKINKFDTVTNILSVDAGCILQNVNDELKQFSCQIPWDLGARGSCQIGGNVSTNAGGLNVVKNGLLRGYILGMEVVLANGQVLDLSSENRKDNTGLDIKQLFIGGEGILGIITKVNIQCLQIPKEKKVMMIELNSYNQVIQTLQLAKKELNDQLNAFEFMEGKIVKKNTIEYQLTSPFEIDESKYYVIVEACGQERIEESLMRFAEILIEEKVSTNCAYNRNETEYKTLWSLRERINETLTRLGYVLKYDVSLPPTHFEMFMNRICPEGGNNLYTVYYGHVGDGNVHINIVYPNLEMMHLEQKQIEEKLYTYLKELRGSISAEHGIGQFKRKKLPLYQKDKQTMELMGSMKHLFDPKNILNPGKVI